MSKHPFSLIVRSCLTVALAASALAGFLAEVQPATALSNGVALTPPMGWNSWNNFGCSVSDTLIRGVADSFVTSGLSTAGYQFVNVDDCWQSTSRDAQGHILPDATNFPNGMKAVADYIHSKGLKFGLYSD